MSFAVVTTIWGDKYDSYVDGWLDSVEPFKANQVIVATDRHRGLPGWVTERVMAFEGRFPAPFYLNQACGAAETDWVWMCDIDDRLRLNAKSVLEFDADIVGIGYARSDGFSYIPDNYSSPSMLGLSWNPIPASSPFKKKVWQANPYPEVVYQDWGFWRKAFRAEFKYVSSGIIGYDYMWHPESSLSGAHANNAEYTREALAC